MGALSAALAIISVVVPFAGGLSLLVTVPMGLLGYRYRLRDYKFARQSPGVLLRLGVSLGGSAGISLASWIFVIIFGRLTAFLFFECDTMPPGSPGYAFAECESAMREANAAAEEYEEESTEGEVTEESAEEPTDGAAAESTDEAPAETPAPDAAPQE